MKISSKFKTNLLEIYKLSIPLAISYCAFGLMGIIDTIVVGNYDTSQLAYIGLASSIFVFLFTVPLGLLQGVLIKSSQKFGARKFASCGKIYNEGKKYSILLSIIFVTIGLNGKFLLTLLDQSPEMVENTGNVLMILVTSIPFVLIFNNADFFLQSIRRVHIGMYGAVIANIINLAINPVLVFGMFGLPAMGAMGAAITTLVIRIFLAVFVLCYIHKMKKSPKLNKRFGLNRSYKSWWKDSKSTRRIGLGTGVISLASNGGFALLSVYAGWLGEFSMAIFVIIINMSALSWLFCYSIAHATSIVVARAYGRKDKVGMVLALYAGYVIYFIVILTIVSLLFLFPMQIFRIFSSDKDVIIALTGLMTYLAISLITDSVPLNVLAALNGRNDVVATSIFEVLTSIFILTISAYIFAFIFNMQIYGLLLGLISSSSISIILGFSRFVYLTKKDKTKSII